MDSRQYNQTIELYKNFNIVLNSLFNTIMNYRRSNLLNMETTYIDFYKVKTDSVYTVKTYISKGLNPSNILEILCNFRDYSLSGFLKQQGVVVTQIEHIVFEEVLVEMAKEAIRQGANINKSPNSFYNNLDLCMQTKKMHLFHILVQHGAASESLIHTLESNMYVQMYKIVSKK